MKRIAIYGKGGIGKSTTAANIAAAMTRIGLKVMQIGCDPKADSTMLHMRGERCPAVLELLRAEGGDVPLESMVRIGADGVICVECGGPMPGTGCAGRGIVTAFEELKKRNAYEIYKPDVLIYDVLGDVVCGGFAMPLRHEYAKNVFVVTSGEKMSLYAAANIALALDHFKGRGYARLTGLIQNSRGVADERDQIAEFAAEAGVPVAGIIPRDPLIQEAEAMQMTLAEAFPDSPTAALYAELAEEMLSLCGEADDEM